LPCPEINPERRPSHNIQILRFSWFPVSRVIAELPTIYPRSARKNT
jgi:hypothetical protein